MKFIALFMNRLTKRNCKLPRLETHAQAHLTTFLTGDSAAELADLPLIRKAPHFQNSSDENNRVVSDITASSAVNALLPKTSAGLAEFWAKRISGLSGRQTEAIAAFLRFMVENHGDDYLSHGPKEALPYWEAAV